MYPTRSPSSLCHRYKRRVGILLLPFIFMGYMLSPSTFGTSVDPSNRSQPQAISLNLVNQLQMNQYQPNTAHHFCLPTIFWMTTAMASFLSSCRRRCQFPTGIQDLPRRSATPLTSPSPLSEGFSHSRVHFFGGFHSGTQRAGDYFPGNEPSFQARFTRVLYARSPRSVD